MYDVLKSLKWFFVKEKKAYFIMFILILMLSLISVVPPYLIGLSIDEIISSNSRYNVLIIIIMSLFFVAISRYFLDRTYAKLINGKGQQLVYELREKYFNKLFELDSKLFEEYSKGDLVSRITQDLDYMKFASTTLLEQFIYSTSNLLFVFTIMFFTISPKLTIGASLFIPVGLIFILNSLKKKRKYYSEHRIIYSEMTETLLESIEGAKVVKAYIQEENEIKKMHKKIEKDIESWRYIVRFESLYVPFMDLTVAISYFMTFLIGSYLVITGQITPGKLVTFSMYIGMINGPIINLSNVLQQVNQAITSKNRLYEILNLKPDVKNEDAQDVMFFEVLQFKNVVFKYPFDEKPTIKDLSMKIKKGQTIGIVGPTGSGKSTIIRQLLREFNIQKGTVFLNNNPIRQYDIEKVRNLIGYVPQSHILFRGNILDNLLIGKQNVEEHEMTRAIRIADFQKDVDFMKEGLTTSVGEFGSGLSGGQKQRLSIARALLKDPEILILDDSLSAVDANTEKNIIMHLKKERANKTNIIVAHRFSAVRTADKIFVINDGVIAEEGTHEELIKNEKWYFEQYNYQVNSLEEED